MRFCEMLQEIQRKKGYPISYFSMMTGISRTAVYRHLHGIVFPSRAMFAKYNEVFHFVDPDDAWAVTDFYYDLKSRE